MKRESFVWDVVLAVGLLLIYGTAFAGCTARHVRYWSGDPLVQDASPQQRAEFRRHMEASDER